ncbi:MAG: DUF1007 family protein [Candidatus Margulisbacteria bacterium]|nr:DUF1007 family protein [Candidatus Margulisiibacteriota bacterium]
MSSIFRQSNALKWLTIIILLVPTIAFSHPHLFVDVEAVIHTKNDNITGIQYDWTFDEMFSSTIYMDYDTDRDQRFSADETKKLKTAAFDNLKEFNYFTKISSLKFKEVQSFTVGKGVSTLQLKDIQEYFGQDAVGKLKTFLVSNSYIDNKYTLQDSFIKDKKKIFAWIRSNIKGQPEDIIQYLTFNTGSKIKYSFFLPFMFPAKGASLKIVDASNFTALEVTRVSFIEDNKYTYKIADNLISIMEVKK